MVAFWLSPYTAGALEESSCQSIVTSRPKPSGERLYWRTHSMFLSTCGRHSQSSLAVYSQAALIPLFMTLIWFSMIYCSSARYIRYMVSK